MEMNVNNTVRVKLSVVGIAELMRQHDDLVSTTGYNGDFNVIVDDEGYTRFQLWALMNMFGHMMALGSQMPFDPMIIIPEPRT